MSKTVAEKLGLKAQMVGWAHNLPSELAELVPVKSKTPTESPDVIVAFVKSVAEVSAALKHVLSHYDRGRSLWFAYPKKTGAIQTDISRDHGWEPLADQDLLPVTQIAIDETWSALRFRYRDEIAKLTRKSDLPGRKETQ